MANLDFSPLYRSTIGFDHMPQMLKSAMRSSDTGNDWPPYNIEKHGDDNYKIVVAVPGFSIDDIDIVAEQNQLTVRGKMAESNEVEYLHRGVSIVPFARVFALADHVQVAGAELQNGLLIIELQREIPERLKPRRINIGASKAKTQKVEKQGKKAACRFRVTG